jgi:uncharacterized protein with ParB-like and HNH nuclease domain
MSDFITLNTLLGNGKTFKVPIYQRDYSWDKDYCEDLWNVILEIPQDKTHYLGYLVLQPETDRSGTYWIIDGQQRISTLSILALSVTLLLRKWAEEGIDSEDNTKREVELYKRYIGNYSLSKLSTSPKLVLNRNNDDYYRTWLLKYRKPTAKNKLKPSQKLLQSAFDYFFAQLELKFNTNKSGAELSEFIEKTVGNGIIFTQIIVENDLDAFKVFETLNARGVKLSTADLLKNYLFQLTSNLGELELSDAERHWQQITETIKANDLTTFIRHYWNSKNPLERQTSLFKAIKREIISPKDAFTLLLNLENTSNYYTAFDNPTDEIWDAKEEREYLKVIKLLNVKTCYPLMLATLEKLDRKEFKGVLKELSVITFRYNISDLNPNEAERVFSKVANDISNNLYSTAKQISLALKQIYVSDENFEQAFSTATINTRRKKDLVKYILIKIENQLANTDYQAEESFASIEHILPENPGNVWIDEFPLDIQFDYVYRLGNYTLLEEKVNNKLGNNLSFQDKKDSYLNSRYMISNAYCNYDKFTPNELSLRQNKIAKIAKTVWKSNFIQSLK